MRRHIDRWWEEPRLSYGRGLLDGYELGHDEAITDILDRVFGGTLLQDATRVIATHEPHHGHPTTPDQPIDLAHVAHNWPGIHHMTTDQRRIAYRALLATWEADS